MKPLATIFTCFIFLLAYLLFLFCLDKWAQKNIGWKPFEQSQENVLPDSVGHSDTLNEKRFLNDSSSSHTWKLRDSSESSSNLFMGYGCGMQFMRGNYNVMVASRDSFAMAIREGNMVWYVNFNDTMLEQHPFVKMLLQQYESDFIKTKKDNPQTRALLIKRIGESFYNTNL